MNDALVGLNLVRFWLFLALSLVIFVLSLWALVDCLMRPASAFPAAGKRTRSFWLILTGLAAVVSFLALPIGVQWLPQIVALVAAVVAIVYLVDVRPAVAPYSRRRGGGGRGPSSRGGW